MSIKVQCHKCDWWDEREPAEIRPKCPECGGVVERASNSKEPSETKSDTV